MNRKQKRQQKFAHKQPDSDQQFVRDCLIQEARGTLQALNHWQYTNGQGQPILLPDMPPSVTVPADAFSSPLSTNQAPRCMFETRIEIVQTDTMSALNGLDNPCALVFASGKKPGGGWLTGAKAQEEDICRHSALWEALKDSPMYMENKKHMPGLYSDIMVYCPRVPILKDDQGWLPSPRVASFVASPAVNAGVVRMSDVHIGNVMLTRMTKILRVMHHYGHTNIVLGSYGCGVFKNNINHVAKWFMELLHGPFKGWFETVRFACIDAMHVKIFNDLHNSLKPMVEC